MPGFNSIDGLSSGLDTTAMVDAIMDFERRPAILLEVQQAEKLAVVSAYQALQAKFLALSSDLSNLVKTSTYEKATIDVSDESYLTAARGSRVGTGSYNFQVLSLANNNQLASQGFDDDSLDSFGTGEILLKVGDGAEKTILIDTNNNSLVGIKTAINEANAGVTASIINDGTSSNSFRLVLSAEKSGKENAISITSNLVDGSNLNYSSSSFDIPETITKNLSSTSQISLGATAAYTGSENTSYTFTVAGSGTQTIGTDTITIDWVDDNNPANSGSIVVTQADFEYEAVGAEGLYMSFGSGDLTAGDKFKIDTFTPLLQNATDAKIAIGSGDGSGSPITVTSSTNSFTDIVGGLNLTVNKLTDPGDSITVKTDVDVKSIRDRIGSFIANYNNLNEYIDKQNSYDPEAGGAPVLFGDFTVWRVQNSMRKKLSSLVQGADGSFNQLYSIGIKTDVKGKLTISNNAKLEESIRNNLDEVIQLFSKTGESSTTGLEFVSATNKTKAGQDFQVDITQAATHGSFEGGTLNDPATTPLIIDASNKKLKFKVDGLVSGEISLSEGTYNTHQDLVNEIQAQILADSKIGKRGVTVEWVEGESGKGSIKLTGSSFGIHSKIELDTAIADSAFSLLGLSSGSTVNGKDVVGTINGEEAEGSGVLLKGKEGNETTEGLVLKVTMDEASVTDAVEGVVSYVQGLASILQDAVINITQIDTGIIDSRITSYEKQIETIKDQVENIDERLALRRESLYKKFYEMETILGKLNAQSQFLETQFAGINGNWGVGSDRN